MDPLQLIVVAMQEYTLYQDYVPFYASTSTDYIQAVLRLPLCSGSQVEEFRFRYAMGKQKIVLVTIISLV